MNLLKYDQTVFELIEKYPEIKEALIEVGLDGVTNPLLLKTAGKKMTIVTGAKTKKIPWEKVVEVFNHHGFKFEEE